MGESVKSWIDELVSKLGELPPPTPGFIKGKLVTIGNLVEALEEGAATRDAEAKIASLEEELGNLQIETEALKSEVDTFRAERKKQEEEKKREDMPEIQFEILQGLPTEHIGDGATLKGISRRTEIPPDESAVHLNRLEKAGFARRRNHLGSAGAMIVAWFRTIAGDELVLAKRLAGEEEKKEIKVKRSKHGKLSNPEETALLTMAKSVNEGATEPEIAKALEYTLAMTAVILLNLSERNMAAASNEPDYGTGRAWFILNNGLEHLAERGLI